MKCPYYSLPDYAFWRRSVSNFAPDVDLVLTAPFSIGVQDKISTAGSCFAQHIARSLQKSGFNYFVTEDASEVLTDSLATKFGYGVFSARYGNIYTARQLNQLFDRAFGEFDPREPFWQAGGYWLDPFRPFIQPLGFSSLEEAVADRKSHLRSVRRVMCESDVFVFTLGLTETWESLEDGAVFPVCPGCGAGDYDPTRYRFKNFSAMEVIGDMNQFVHKLRSVNPDVKVILTVSPVPLIATMEDRSVVVSTSYSKAALRVAAEETARLPQVAYFPSYEIVTSNYSQGSFFADDWREVREDGVQKVMRLFLKYYCGTDTEAEPSQPVRRESNLSISEKVANIICDEENLDPASSSAS